MATYFLVPGGKRAAQDWDSVGDILRARGHHAYAITLSDPEASTLTDHIAEVVGAIEAQDLRHVILAGHSYGTFVITGAADPLAKRIAKLVYVDGGIPHPGQSLFDLLVAKNIDTEKFGIPRWPPFVEPLRFDEATIRQIPKLYVRATQSQFKQVNAGYPDYVASRAKTDHWEYREIDSDHYCMINNARALADILLAAATEKENHSSSRTATND